MCHARTWIAARRAAHLLPMKRAFRLPRPLLGLAFLAALAAACTSDRPRAMRSGFSGSDGAEPVDVGDAALPGDQGEPHADQGPPPADTSSRCRIDSDCQPGTYCKDGRCWFDCRMNSDCAPSGFACVNGRCLPLSGCTTDSSCQPPLTVCEGERCVPGCLETGCDGGLRCDPQRGRCTADDPGRCTADRDCAPPQTICVGERCVPGCLELGCGEGLRCRPDTGRCEPDAQPGCQGDGDCDAHERCDPVSGECVPRQAQDLPLGADCARGGECASGMCLGVTVASVPWQVCSKVCCSEYDCGAGLACHYLNGVQICLPTRIFPLGQDMRAAGQPCGPGGGNSCLSGICVSGECAQGCCRDADCRAGGTCWWSGDAAPFCDLLAWIQGGPPGSYCGNPVGIECQSGICLGDPDSPWGGVCAGSCCSDGDCAGGQVCAQIAGPFGPAQGTVAYGCVDLPRGPGQLGDPCNGPNDGDACASGSCFENRCSTTCCTDAQCPAGFVCQVAQNGEGGYVRACIPES